MNNNLNNSVKDRIMIDLSEIFHQHFLIQIQIKIIIISHCRETHHQSCLLN